MSEEKEVQGEVIEENVESTDNSSQESNASTANAEQQNANAQEQSSQSQQQEEPKQTYEPATPSKEERDWAMFCHLSTMAGFFIPFFSIIGPLIVWLIKRDEMEYVNYHGKEVLNFQITIALAMFVSIILTVILIGVVMIFVVGVFWFVMSIIGGVKASSGEYFEYPFTLRLIK
ncbi:DUF4870 domain-containing protein [Pseudoteredinibacter isoporae]|uniref:DUF4870 domain-containing protein n=1 Tax=Pseudoteredinibacter isoporae TaxID=570281 RepID=A0A7X0JSJ1_9GAMM|nr:DUF4870 domain-containing protein [Pseudoteredinibacter isoporae]MBB6520521.1 hypothetical protein [Pseudoteredinibacter isoporae]